MSSSVVVQDRYSYYGCVWGYVCYVSTIYTQDRFKELYPSSNTLAAEECVAATAYGESIQLEVIVVFSRLRLPVCNISKKVVHATPAYMTGNRVEVVVHKISKAYWALA